MKELHEIVKLLRKMKAEILAKGRDVTGVIYYQLDDMEEVDKYEWKGHLYHLSDERYYLDRMATEFLSEIGISEKKHPEAAQLIRDIITSKGMVKIGKTEDGKFYIEEQYDVDLTDEDAQVLGEVGLVYLSADLYVG